MPRTGSSRRGIRASRRPENPRAAGRIRAVQHASALAGWYESLLTAFYVDTTLPIENGADVEDFTFAPSAVVEATRSSRAAQDVRSFVNRASPATKVDVAVEESTHVEGAILPPGDTPISLSWARRGRAPSTDGFSGPRHATWSAAPHVRS
jgi:hypothetical protein